jgi:hypothetical protein
MSVNILSMPTVSFDWFQVAYPIISGIVVTIIIGLISYFRNHHRYRNLLICIMIEMNINYQILTSTIEDGSVNLVFDSWDNTKIEIIHRLPEKLVGSIEICYSMIKPLNGYILKDLKLYCQEQNIDLNYAITMLKGNLLEIIGLAKIRKIDLFNIENSIK